MLQGECYAPRSGLTQRVNRCLPMSRKYVNPLDDTLSRQLLMLPLSMVATVLLTWAPLCDAELVLVRAEGRVHKVDASLPAGSEISVGSQFVFEFTYETDANRTIVVKGLRIGPAEHLADNQRLYGRVNHFARVGGWDRLRLSVQSREASSVDDSKAEPQAFTVKMAFDSRTEVGSVPSVVDGDPLRGDVLESVLSREKFFHLLFNVSDAEGQSDGLISGEITSVTRIGD